MTVWTNVTLDEANAWLAVREMGLATAIHPIEEGSEDSVFRLDREDGPSVFLRLFERMDAKGPLSIAVRLADCGLPTCPPIEDNNKRLFVNLKGKPASLFPWIEGAWEPKPSLRQIEEIGVFLGRMGLDGPEHCVGWTCENPRGWPWFEESTQSVAPFLDKEMRRLIEEETSAQKTFWHGPEAAGIPLGPVHADLFRNNVMFGPDGSLAAVIDWVFCASDWPLVYDLAIVANEWCLKDNGYELGPRRLEALLHGREQFLPMNDAEKKAWPMSLRLAALRFSLSRFYDYYLPRAPDGKKLDPDHFPAILRERKKIKR